MKKIPFNVSERFAEILPHYSSNTRPDGYELTGKEYYALRSYFCDLRDRVLGLTTAETYSFFENRIYAVTSFLNWTWRINEDQLAALNRLAFDIAHPELWKDMEV